MGTSFDIIDESDDEIDKKNINEEKSDDEDEDDKEDKYEISSASWGSGCGGPGSMKQLCLVFYLDKLL